MERHPIEDEASWQAHLTHQSSNTDESTATAAHRSLRHQHNEVDVLRLESEAHAQDEKEAAKKQRMEQKLVAKADKKRRKKYAELYRSSGIGKESVHGLMVSVFGTVDAYYGVWTVVVLVCFVILFTGYMYCLLSYESFALHMLFASLALILKYNQCNVSFHQS